jgi:hypothetical protein
VEVTPMKGLRLSAAAALALATGIVAHASGPIAVYAKVDRVVMEPNEEAPERIQVFGAFAIASASNTNSFGAPVRGYLYYRVPAKLDNANDTDMQTARNEFRDLKAVAGTNQIVAFGGQWMGVPTVRKVDAPPQSPDLFTLNVGIRKISDTATFAPIKALRDFR